jgi:hypothetical protein
MTPIKIAKESHLITTAGVRIWVLLNYNTCTAPLRKERSTIPELSSCTVTALPLLFSYFSFNSPMTLTMTSRYAVERLTYEDHHQTQPFSLCNGMLFPMSYMFRPKSTNMFRILKILLKL